jgi:Dolichyl-phosphate-mannose-protein mannosyltransferase
VGRVLVLVVASAALRFAAALGVHSPWIAPDEMIYGLVGRTLWAHARLTVLDGPTPYYSLAYPVVAGLPYDAAKAVGAIALSSTAVPIYLWGRELTTRAWALAAAAMTLALPTLVYSGTLLTEVLFVPEVALAAWLTARALEQPTAARQAQLAAALALAFVTRLQANTLLVALVVAALATRRLRALWRVWLFAGAAIALWLVLHAGSPRDALGGYASATGGYHAGAAVRHVAAHLADLGILTGVVPLLAVVLLARERDPRVRAYVAVTGSIVAATVAEVGVFASKNADHVLERTVSCLAPLLILGFAVWLGRGAPRGHVLAPVVAAVVAALLFTIRLGHEVTAATLPDAPSFALLVEVRDAVGLWGLRAGYAAGVVALLTLAVCVPRRGRVALVAAVALTLCVASAAATREQRRLAESARMSLVGPDARWIDHAAAGPVAYLYDGDPYWNEVWAQAYWNRSVAAVVDFDAARVPGPMPQRTLGPIPANGALRGLRQRYVAASGRFTFRGSEIAATPLRGVPTTRLRLWRLAGPPRVDTVTSGLETNGDIAALASVRVFDCGPGALEIAAFAKSNDETVTLLRNGRAIQARHLTPWQPWSVDLTTRRAGAGQVCQFDVKTTGVLGTTTFRWVRGAGGTESATD